MAVKPGDMILMTDLYDSTSINYLYVVGCLLILGEVLSLAMVSGILSYLRSHASLFSKLTYKLHLQFTMLLAVQVGQFLIQSKRIEI